MVYIWYIYMVYIYGIYIYIWYIYIYGIYIYTISIYIITLQRHMEQSFISLQELFGVASRPVEATASNPRLQMSQSKITQNHPEIGPEIGLPPVIIHFIEDFPIINHPILGVKPMVKPMVFLGFSHGLGYPQFFIINDPLWGTGNIYGHGGLFTPCCRGWWAPPGASLRINSPKHDVRDE